jgi:hypothetical protein
MTVRGCDGCTLCCKLVPVRALEKPAFHWCPHCAPGVGCKIYADRPRACSAFECMFLRDPDLSEEWRPSKSKLVLTIEPFGGGLEVYVDPGRPNAWRDEPFISKLRSVALAMASSGAFITIYVGNRATVLVGDREIYVGVLGEDEVVICNGIDAFKLKQDDPRIANKPDDRI